MTDTAAGAGARAAQIEHLVRAAEDALTDDTVARIAQTAADGMDLVDQVNRAGLAKAIPALAALVHNGDLERIVALARAFGAAEDALTDDMVNRLSESVADGLGLLDKVNRSGVERALPAIASLVDSGDLDRLVALARLYGAAQDALTDDMISRVAEAIAEGLSLLDRFNRGGAGHLVRMLETMDASGSLERTCATVPRVADRLDTMLQALDAAGEATARGAPSRGGLFAALGLLQDAENLEALRYLINIGKELRKRSGA